MTERPSLEAKMAKAVRHIEQGRRHIAKLEEHIAEPRRDGHRTLMSRKLLAAMQEIQQFLECDRDQVVNEIEEFDRANKHWH